jgi:release factor glutamine methyltransferase
VTILTYAEFLKRYFDSERKILSQNYPGLTLHRLTSEAPVDNLDDVYLPSRSHPLSLFIEKIKAGIPLEYISGLAYFYKTIFSVNEKVLIPRSETEILVEMAVQEIQCNFKNKSCKVLDICTGSGAIGLSLLREGGASFDLTLSDISEDALEVARKNYFRMQFLFSATDKIEFIKSDRFLNITGTFDLILSNPPYIKEINDKNEVHSQVLKYEPRIALFINDDEYDKWFKEFLTGIYKHLVNGGLALMEGHENHLEDLKEMAIEIGFKKAEIVQDYSQRNRFLRLIK